MAEVGWACPRCRRPLRQEGEALRCGAHEWAVRRVGAARIPDLHEEAEVRGKDRLMRAIYDGLPRLYDPFTTVAFPLTGAGSERGLREHAVRRLGIRTGRVLEVGIGTGANLPFLRSFDLWGVDLSFGMLRVLAKRHPELRLAVADVHALPFEDASFDAVLHVGATNNFRDPKAAVAEMARVCRPGGRVVVVDERLAPGSNLWHRVAFRAVTFYESRLIPPMDVVPAGATDILDEQPSRVFYCLSFAVGAR